MGYYDVIVVGAGAIGSYVAWELSRRGFAILLLDKKELPGKEVCAGVLSVDAFEEFPLPKESVLNSIEKMKVFSPLGSVLEYRHPKPLAYIVDRPAFDRSLLGRALMAGAEFKGGFGVRGAEAFKSGIEIWGDKGSEKAKMAIIACGFNPSLVSSLGFGIYPSWVEGVQTTVFTRDVEGVEIHLGKVIAPGAFAWILPLDRGNIARVGLVTKREGRRYLRSFLDREGVKERILENHQPIRGAYLPTGPVSRSFGERMLVVGEAAGQVKTTTYGGVYYGLVCAREAVFSLLNAFESGNFSQDLLCIYEKRWRARILKDMNAGRELSKRFEAMDDEEIEGILKAIKKSHFLFLIKGMARFDWHREVISLATKKRIL